MEGYTVERLKEELRNRALSEEGSRSVLLNRLNVAVSTDEKERKESGEDAALQGTVAPGDSVSQYSSASGRLRFSTLNGGRADRASDGHTMVFQALMERRSQLHDELCKLGRLLKGYEQDLSGEQSRVIVQALLVKETTLQDDLAALERTLEGYERDQGCIDIQQSGTRNQEPGLNVHAEVYRPRLPPSYEGTGSQVRPPRDDPHSSPAASHYQSRPVKQSNYEPLDYVGSGSQPRQPSEVWSRTQEATRYPSRPFKTHNHQSLPVTRPMDPSLMETMISFNLKGLMPKSEVPKFNGDSTKYRSFIRAFDGIVCDRLSSDEEKLQFLGQFTTGRPKEIVDACLNLPPGQGYQEARQKLHTKYGKDEVIAGTYLNKILNWSKIKDDDGEGLEEFSICLVACQNVIRGGVKGATEFELPTTVRKVVFKLPNYLQEKWRCHAHKIEKRESRTAGFEDLVYFVVDQAQIATNPVYGRQYKDTSDNPKENRAAKKDDGHGRQEKNKPKATVNAVVGSPEPRRATCTFCSKEHYLEDCEELRKKPEAERLSYVKENELCFSCLRTGHTSWYCRRKKVCKICKGKHPTLLHKDRPRTSGNERAESNSNNSPSTSRDQVAANSQVRQARVLAGKSWNKVESPDKLSIIPIKVRASNGDLIPTYAFLDQGSTTTFCTRELLGKLTHQDTRPAELRVSTMFDDRRKVDSEMVTGIVACDFNENNFVSLPTMFTVDRIPVSKDEIVRREDYESWPHLRFIDLPEIDADIGLMLGRNVGQSIEPIEVIPSPEEGGAFAIRTKLGWVVFGPEEGGPSTYARVNRVRVDDVTLDNMLINLYNQEVLDINSTERGLSGEDKLWIEKVEASCKVRDNGHYEMGLPFKDEVPKLPNNKVAVVKRLEGLRKRLRKDTRFHADYTEFMTKLLREGYAEEVPRSELQNQGAWYIPHHGVYHHQKTDQLRVVFDCAAKYKNISLNETLLQGPDLTNPLVEVLIKFRQGPFAFTADVRSMFYQVMIPENDRDYLRFLWWPSGNTVADPVEYRMTVHPFGAKSSPSCANFALRRTAKDYGNEYTSEARNTVLYNFYVDDCLKATDSEENLVKTAKEVKDLCNKGGFELTKFVSNSRKLLAAIPVEDRGKKVKEIDLNYDSLPTERALGIKWDIETDSLTVSIKEKDKPLTRRGILSTIGSMYDPLGMVSPFLLQGRLIMQDLCRLNLGWDETIPEVHQTQWKDWKGMMLEMDTISLDRCMKPEGFGKIASSQVHHFADASEKGYGTCSYLRLCNQEGKIHCSFIFGKARVAPLKAVTIPRLELMAAVSAVRVNRLIESALEIPVQRTIYWTDSTTVLRYIRNESSRFHTFVANRLSVIREGSHKDQWKYVNSELNPADDASRGAQSERWLKGPGFLYSGEGEWPKEPLVMREEGLEIKCFVGASSCTVPDKPFSELLQRYSSWQTLRKTVAWILRVRAVWLGKVRKTENVEIPRSLTVEELNEAERVITRLVQEESFSTEKPLLDKGKKLRRDNPIRRLNPFVHEGLLRVGGRLLEAPLNFDVMHPIILPKNHHVTDLIIRYHHEKVGHQGREHVLSSLRERYWIMRGNSAVRKVVKDCITCRKYQAPVLQQQMANLPGDTVFPCDPPFTRTGVDCFGPFHVKRGRVNNVKRYGVIFTCLTVHAIHIEVAESLSTDSFISAMRRFIARRGQVKSIRCDRGTNFVGASRQLKEAVKEWNQASISETLLMKDIDWIFNPPYASHHGGVWERQIRTVRKVLNAVMLEQVLTDESLNTLMCEVEAVVNSRPLTNTSSDPKDPEPLTPNHLLVMRNGPFVVGLMNKEDMYSRRRWKQVQYLADLFWKRWKYEYLLTLQQRQKWHVEGRNLQVGDIVLLAEDSAPRGQWPTGRVIAVKQGRDGLVRSADVKSKGSVFCRPLSKLVLLCKNEGD